MSFPATPSLAARTRWARWTSCAGRSKTGATPGRRCAASRTTSGPTRGRCSSPPPPPICSGASASSRSPASHTRRSAWAASSAATAPAGRASSAVSSSVGRSELSLSETNARLGEFEARENASRPSRTKVAGRTVSRAAAWVALTNGRPADNRLRRLPKHPIETLAREARRRVDIGGIVRWGGREYEVEPAAAPRLIGRRVIARRALAAEPGRDALAIEDPATGERALAHPYGPRAYGEVRSAPATPLERLTEADVVAQQSAQDVAGADLFVPKPGAGKRGVLSMPARTAAAERLENPLDAERHRDLDQAMRALVELYPHPLSPANRAAAAAHLERHNLERRAVVELANRLLALSTAVG